MIFNRNKMEVKLDFYSGNAEYFTRTEYITIRHSTLNNVKYAVVRETKNIKGLEKWISTDEKIIFEDDPILENYTLTDHCLCLKARSIE